MDHHGNYGGTLPVRLARADTVIDLDLAPWLCVAGILRRLIGPQASARPDMAAGCKERPNREFLEFVVYTATFRKRVRPRIARNMSGFGGRYVRLTSRSEVARFLDNLSAPRI